MRLVIPLLAIGWLALYLSSHALLVWSEGPYRSTPQSQEALDCTYFTGLGFVTSGYWYSSNGIMGRVACPRLIRL